MRQRSYAPGSAVSPGTESKPLYALRKENKALKAEIAVLMSTEGVFLCPACEGFKGFEWCDHDCECCMETCRCAECRQNSRFRMKKPEFLT